LSLHELDRTLAYKRAYKLARGRIWLNGRALPRMAIGRAYDAMMASPDGLRQ